MSSNNKSLVSSGGRGANKNKSQHGKSDHHQTKSDLTKHDKAQVGKLFHLFYINFVYYY